MKHLLVKPHQNPKIPTNKISLRWCNIFYYEDVFIRTFHQIFLTCQSDNIIIISQIVQFTSIFLILVLQDCYLFLQPFNLLYSLLTIHKAVVIHKTYDNNKNTQSHNVLCIFEISYSTDDILKTTHD